MTDSIEIRKANLKFSTMFEETAYKRLSNTISTGNGNVAAKPEIVISLEL